MNVHQVAPRQPILLATSTIDVGVDALAEAGISELLPPGQHRAGGGRWCAACAAAFKGAIVESKRCLNAAHSLRLKGEEFGWVLTSERPHPAHFAREPVSKLNGVTR